jgi:hypothetical protein
MKFALFALLALAASVFGGVSANASSVTPAAVAAEVQSAASTTKVSHHWYGHSHRRYRYYDRPYYHPYYRHYPRRYYRRYYKPRYYYRPYRRHYRYYY